MNQKSIGLIVIILGVVIAAFVFFAKAKEDAYISSFIEENGTCYLADGTCLHEDRDFTLYIVGWSVAAGLCILGVYLLYFDKTQQVLAEQQVKVTSALKEAKQKDEFTAFLSGFSPDEQKILKEVHEEEGVKQSTLRYRLGLSKATLSLLLQGLEKRGIVSKKSAGKTNELYLVKRF